MRKEDCNYCDFAILYRTNSQSRTFEDELRNHAMPYRIVGSMEFFQRKEIKDVIAYFRVVVNPHDEEAIKRIINYPIRGIGNVTLQKIVASARESEVSIWDVLCRPNDFHFDVNRGILSKLNSFVELIKRFMSNLSQTDAFELANLIVKESSILADLYQSDDAESISRQENVEELLNSISEFVDSRREEGQTDRISLGDFLQQVSLQTDADDGDNDENKINLMTIHAAKGLEFSTVFVVGLEEKIFPSLRSSNSLKELEEERRLLYVAITRAQKHCILTSAKNRWRYSQMEMTTPSRFIHDISSCYLDVISPLDSSSTGSRNTYGCDTVNKYKRYDSWQNSNPIGSQFMVDKKPKITRSPAPETAVDPFSAKFKNAYTAHGGNLKRLSSVMSNGGRTNTTSAPSAIPTVNYESIKEGSIIEHQRFGIGKIVNIEGIGENTKATVEFKNTGTKQLLLKFARFTVKG